LVIASVLPGSRSAASRYGGRAAQLILLLERPRALEVVG
jgi:hypothetical protein